MPLWDPPASVGANEYIGRRLFDEPLLAGADDQDRFEGILLTHFQENRGDDWSVDRLGNGVVNRAVVRYLSPRAELNATGFKPPKRFDGWTTIRIGELARQWKASLDAALEILPSPVPGENGGGTSDLTANSYHASIIKLSDTRPFLMALQLRHFFTRFGKVERADR